MALLASVAIGFDGYYQAGGSHPDMAAQGFKTVYRRNGISTEERAQLQASSAFYRIQEEEGTVGEAHNMISILTPASYAGAVITLKKALYTDLCVTRSINPLTTTWGCVVHGQAYAPGSDSYNLTATLADDSLWLNQLTGGGSCAPQIYYTRQDFSAAYTAEWDEKFAEYVARSLGTGCKCVPYLSPLIESAPWGIYLSSAHWLHQLEVMRAAHLNNPTGIPGFIILAGYEFPTVNSGTAQSGSTSTTIKLAAAASAVDDAYNGYTVRVRTGTGSGQQRPVDDYTGSTRTAAVSAWDVTPDATSTYDVGTIAQVAWNASADAWLADVITVFGDGAVSSSAAGLLRRRRMRN